jgi:ribosomal protein S14
VRVDHDIADPARGEKVRRCAICGAPETTGNKLIVGLWAYIRLTFDLALCERCIREHAPRLDPDPMQVTLEELG